MSDTPGLTERLGVYGWRHLDAVLLAALATEAPVLLVGPHGTAKTLLVERIGAALGLEFRHYNASLINYDDLVGIPLPDDTGTALRFVATPESIWGAELVFFDEVSRCRPDLQNKLFPIVHERRVAGVLLEGLRYRWAAMNPPAADDPDAEHGDVYLGSEPLDPALADRFPFVVAVPGWRDLDRAARRHLIGGAAEPDAIDDSGLRSLVERCRTAAAPIGAGVAERVTDYTIALVDLLGDAGLPQSPRRAWTLARGVVAVHAARIALTGGGVELEESAELAVRHGLPQTASEIPPSPAAVLAAHQQAWQVSSLAFDDALRQVFEERDPVARVALGDRLGLADGEVSRLMTQALEAVTTDARRVGAATAMFLAFRDRRDLRPSAWEPLVRLARRVLEPRDAVSSVAPGPSLERSREISAFVATQSQTTTRQRLEANYLHAGADDLFDGVGWRQALTEFRCDLDRFGGEGEP